MKKLILCLLILITFDVVYADGMPSNTTMGGNNTNTMDMPQMDMSQMHMPEMMYMDFGLGMGGASSWSSTSMAINVMTMGFYVHKNLGVELGMDMLPNGTYENSGAMINTFHLAAKGILPLANAFSLYGKLGVGVNAGQGTSTSDSMMGGMEMQNMAMITPVNVGPYYGGGLQFNLSKKFAFYVEDSGVAAVGGSTTTAFGNTNMVTAGLEVRM